MESVKIEILLEKYFRGESSVAEENELRTYFSSSDVAQHLEQYKPLFGYFSLAKRQKFTQEMPKFEKPENKKRNLTWLSIAASIVVLLGIGTFTFFNQENAIGKKDLGTYDDPELAFKETQKALAMLSNHVNVGIGSVQYIQEYQNTKEKIFNQ